MQQTGPKHRRTQSASISAAQNRPIEIVVTSPGSDSFPLSPLSAPTRSNLFPPTERKYELLQENEGGVHSRTSGGRTKLFLLIALVLVTLVELAQYGNERVKGYNEMKRIVLAQEEEQRNLVRREIAATLFPNTTFYPSPFVDSSPRTPSTSRGTDPKSTHTNGYLFPIRIVEQESKAQLHLHQLALLSISLNRTLVLPNVGGSRLHSCHLFPFAFHYDIDEWVERFEGKLSVIAQEDWLATIEDGQKSVSLRSLRLVEGKKAVLGAAADSAELQENRLDLSDFCLDRASGFFIDCNPPLSTLFAPLRYREFDDLALAGFSNSLVASLSRFSPSSPDSAIPSHPATIPSSMSTIPADVLIVDYDLRYPIFPAYLPNSTDLFPSLLSNSTRVEGRAVDSVSGNKRRIIDTPHYDPFPFLQRLASSSSHETSSSSHKASTSSHDGAYLSFFPMPYSTLWQTIASSIADNLAPYLATHWRMENVPLSHLVPCATSLARTLDSLDGAPTSPSAIFLASDYPFDALLKKSDPKLPRSSPARPLSDTFHSLSSSHRAAASRLIRLIKPSPTIFSWLFSTPPSLDHTSPRVETLTTLLDSNRSLLPPHLVKLLSPLEGDLFSLDPGLRGILDKLVLARSEYFVAGWGEKGSEMCGKGSSFTESVISERRRRRRRKQEQQQQREGQDAGDSQNVEVQEGVGSQEEEEDIVRWFKKPV